MIESYETMRFEEGGASLDVKVSLEDKKAYLSTEDMATLFGRDRSAMARQIKNAYSEKELEDGGMRAKVAHMVPGEGKATCNCCTFLFRTN